MSDDSYIVRVICFSYGNENVGAVGFPNLLTRNRPDRRLKEVKQSAIRKRITNISYWRARPTGEGERVIFVTAVIHEFPWFVTATCIRCQYLCTWYLLMFGSHVGPPPLQVNEEVETSRISNTENETYASRNIIHID